MTHNSFVVSNCCGIGGLFGLCQKSAESENKHFTLTKLTNSY